MRLEGWNSIPAGFGARFDLRAAPWWLRWWAGTPFLDRFAYPVLVGRGHGWLVRHPDTPPDRRPPPGSGWRLRPPGYESPGSVSWLTPDD
jgi:hypothetical protein